MIKEIDRLESGLTGTPREQIMREVRARIELETRSQKKLDPKVAATFVPGEAKPASDAKPETKADGKLEAKLDAHEGMDADSTTSVEPKRNETAKEATP